MQLQDVHDGIRRRAGVARTAIAAPLLFPLNIDGAGYKREKRQRGSLKAVGIRRPTKVMLGTRIR